MEENEAERDRKMEDPRVNFNGVKAHEDRREKGRKEFDIKVICSEERGEGQKKIKDFKTVS
jgi:hypothetical protein